MLALARSRGMNARIAGTPEQERERTQQMMAQRTKDREKQDYDSAVADASKLQQLKLEYKAMKEKYESLGGSNWQYADREQNLSDSERKARSMEPALRDLASRIHRAEKIITKGVDEAVAPAQAAPAQPAGNPVQQKADQMQQALLDRMGKRFGLPPGSSMEQVQAAQQAYLDKNDPAAAAQYKQNMTNIDAGQTNASQKPVQLAPQPAPAPAPVQPAAATSPAQPAPAQPAAAPAKPNLGADFEAGLAAQKAGGNPTEIMLAQPAIAGNQQLVDQIAATLGLPAGTPLDQVKAAAATRPQAVKANAEQQAIDDMAKKQGFPAGLTKDQFYKMYQDKLNKQQATMMPKQQAAPAPAQPAAPATPNLGPVAEGEPGDLEHELNRQEYNDDKIAGLYEPDDFDQMVKRLGQRAKEQERKHGPVDLAKLAQRLRDLEKD